jgi:hypothetical protein
MTSRTPPPIDQGDTIIAVIGDWHGNTRWAVKTIEQIGAAGIRTAMHVGDFGLFRFPYSKPYLNAVEKAAAAADLTIWITDGNHEDHTWRLELETVNNGNPAKIRPHVWLLPRGHRWTHAGRSFLSFGGATSIDFLHRPKHSWWATEIVTEQDIERAAAGGYVDVMIAHDAPAPATLRVDHIRASNPMGWPLKSLMYAATGTHAMTRAYDAVQPRLFLHGHYHVHGAAVIDGRTIISIDQDGHTGNVVFLDLKTLEATWMDHEAAPNPSRLTSWEAAYMSPTP